MSRYWMAVMILVGIIGSAVVSASALEIRGQVATDNFVWNPQNFAGFDYDIDRDIGTETLTTTITEGKKFSGDDPYGITYEASKLVKAFSNANIGMKYGKLTVMGIDPVTGAIILNNKGGRIVLSKNVNAEIMPGLWIKTANNDSLRYYIYKNITTPGTYEVRGAVATDSFTWNPQNFACFFYDMDKDLGTEALTTTVTEGKNLSGDPIVDPSYYYSSYGVIYQTTAQGKDHIYRGWGSYKTIGFLGKEYFAGYIEEGNPLFWESVDENSLSDEQLQEVLLDDNTKSTLKKGESIKLKEGYELFLKGFNSEGQIYLELKKNGKLVDESFFAPSMCRSTVRDNTYFYRANVGEQRGLVTIAVHFQGIYKDDERALAVVDGIWQISDTAISVMADAKFGKMTIRTIDATAGTIVMDNKDNPITLERNIDVELAPDLYIRTADNETLRYYLYRKVKVE